MTILTEGKRKAEFLVSEANGYRARDRVVVTIPANTTIPAGRVMAMITATSRYVPHVQAGLDNGTRNPRALLFDNLVNDTGAPVDVTATVVSRDAEYRIATIVYDPARDAAGRATDRAALAAFGLIGR